MKSFKKIFRPVLGKDAWCSDCGICLVSSESSLATVIRYHRIPSTHQFHSWEFILWPLLRTTKFTCKKKFTVAVVIVVRNWNPPEALREMTHRTAGLYV